MARWLRQLPWLLALCGAAACASSSAVPRPFPEPALRGAADAPADFVPAPDLDPLVSTALSLRGSPYRNGGSAPSGFDCSGFVWYVFANHSIALPRTVAEQYRVGHPVSANQLRPGDLVFFQTGQSPASHVGVLVGGDWFIHAPSSRGEVRVEHLSAPYWSRRYVGARRVDGVDGPHAVR